MQGGETMGWGRLQQECREWVLRCSSLSEPGGPTKPACLQLIVSLPAWNICIRKEMNWCLWWLPGKGWLLYATLSYSNPRAHPSQDMLVHRRHKKECFASLHIALLLLQPLQVGSEEHIMPPADLWGVIIVILDNFLITQDRFRSNVIWQSVLFNLPDRTLEKVMWLFFMWRWVFFWDTSAIFFIKR